MRRFLLICIMTAVMLTGCGKKQETENAETTAYEGYYTTIDGTARFQDSSLYYTVSGSMARMKDGTYRYYVFIDNAQIAMYDIAVMIVEDDIPYSNSKKMMPNIGVLDETKFSMIPNQSYPEGGFVKGIALSGESEKPSVKLEMLVEWKDKTKEKTNREFLAFNLTPDGFDTSKSVREAAE